MNKFLCVGPYGGLTRCDGGLENFQAAVGGNIVFGALPGSETALFLNDEGLFLDLPLNIPVFLATRVRYAGPAILIAAKPVGDGETVPAPNADDTAMRITGLALALGEAQIKLASVKATYGVTPRDWRNPCGN